ncbi:hypothetical protein Tco_1537819, partial [Tanacetum coccineum]
MVVVPSDQTMQLVDHTIIYEIKEHSGKNKRKVGFNIVPPPVKKARTGGIAITEPVATSARKSPATIQKLIVQSSQADVGSGSAASRAKEFVSSSFTPTPDRGDHEDSGSIMMGMYRTMCVEGGAMSSFLLFWQEDGAFNLGMSWKDVEIASLKDKLRKAESEAATVVGLHKKVSDLEDVYATRLDEIASLTAQNAKLSGTVSGLELVCDGLKNKVAKLEVDCKSLRGEVAGDTKMREEFASICSALSSYADCRSRGRWVIGHGFCLAVMKCAQSIECRA